MITTVSVLNVIVGVGFAAAVVIADTLVPGSAAVLHPTGRHRARPAA